MEGNVKYQKVYEAANKIKQEVAKLEQELESYNENIKKIGSEGGAYAGNAAESANQVLSVIYNNVSELKRICNEFSDNASTAAQMYQETDTKSTNAMESIL